MGHLKIAEGKRGFHKDFDFASFLKVYLQIVHASVRGQSYCTYGQMLPAKYLVSPIY